MAKRKESVLKDLILAPWWVSLVLAVIAYVALSSAKPLAPVALLVCFLFIGFACISALRAWGNRRMLDHQTGLNSLRELPWKRFEDLLGEAYRRHGYQVTETLGGGADGGVDLVLRREGKVTLVQCKRWRRSASLSAMWIQDGAAGSKARCSRRPSLLGLQPISELPRYSRLLIFG